MCVAPGDPVRLGLTGSGLPGREQRASSADYALMVGRGEGGGLGEEAASGFQVLGLYELFSRAFVYSVSTY